MKKPLTLAFLILAGACADTDLSYLGQEPPGETPNLFATGIVNTDAIELNEVNRILTRNLPVSSLPRKVLSTF